MFIIRATVLWDPIKTNGRLQKSLIGL